MKKEVLKSQYRELCLNCRRPESVCICSSVNPIKTQSQFIILMHPMEFKKVKNGTGRMSKLQLKNSEIIIGVDFSNNDRVNYLIAKHSERAFILYPGELSTKVQDANMSKVKNKPNIVFLIDATWPCAKKMMKLSTNLKKIPKISFDQKYHSQFQIKQQPTPECLSTIESIHHLLIELNDDNIEDLSDLQLDQFLLPFQRMNELQIECANDPTKGLYRTSQKEKYARKKENYKQNPMTKIFYAGYDS